MELPEVRNADSPRDLLRDLGEVYTDNVKLGRDVVYSHILREGVRVIVIREIYFLFQWLFSQSMLSLNLLENERNVVNRVTVILVCNRF